MNKLPRFLLLNTIVYILLISFCFNCVFSPDVANANPVVAVAPGVVAGLGTALIYAGYQFEDEESLKACAVDLYRSMSTSMKKKWDNIGSQLAVYGSASLIFGHDLIQSIRYWRDNEYEDGQPVEVQTNGASMEFDVDDTETVSYIPDVLVNENFNGFIGYSGNIKGSGGRVGIGRFRLNTQYAGMVDGNLTYNTVITDMYTSDEVVVRSKHLGGSSPNCVFSVSFKDGIVYCAFAGTIYFERPYVSSDNQCYLNPATGVIAGGVNADGVFAQLIDDAVIPVEGDNFEVDPLIYDSIMGLINNQLMLSDAILDLQNLVGQTSADLAVSGAVTHNDVAIPEVLNPPVPEVYPDTPDVAVGETGWLSSISSWLDAIWNAIVGGLQSVWSVLYNVWTSVYTITDVVTVGLVGNVADINLSGLQNLGLAVSDRFPFCLPWDVKNAISSLSYSDEIPVFDVAIPALMPGSSPVVVGITIPEEFRFIIDFIRGALLFIFTLGLVMLTSRFLGGDG